MTARPLISKTDQSTPTNETQTPHPVTVTAPTNPAQSGGPKRQIDTTDPVLAVSIALRQSEFDELQQFADGLGGSRGSLMTALLRRAIRDLRAGRIQFVKRGVKLTEAGEDSK